MMIYATTYFEVLGSQEGGVNVLYSDSWLTFTLLLKVLLLNIDVAVKHCNVIFFGDDILVRGNMNVF